MNKKDFVHWCKNVLCYCGVLLLLLCAFIVHVVFGFFRSKQSGTLKKIIGKVKSDNNNKKVRKKKARQKGTRKHFGFICLLYVLCLATLDCSVLFSSSFFLSFFIPIVSWMRFDRLLVLL